jgi:hypothetical protein
MTSQDTPILLKPAKHNFYLLKDRYHFILICLMIFSYFYNLPVIGYSVSGDNELRLYDILGIYVLFIFVMNYSFYSHVIKKTPVFKWFYWFVLWCSITILITFLFSIFKDRLLRFLQSVLYLYHLWVFFVTAVLFYVMSFNRKNLIHFVYLLLFCSLCSGVIIILQNLGFIPFLWNRSYEVSYAGFLSGTLGPNKIVSGMYSMIMAIFSVGLLFNKKHSVSKILLIAVIIVNLYVLLLSGSRTSYVGLIVFIVFFSFYKTSGFLFFAIFFGSSFMFLLNVNEGINEKVMEVIEGRVVNKIQSEEDLENANVETLYEDLGSGRSTLSLKYIDYLGNNPEIIPFGQGFNNRLLKGFSAHNMYLNLIKELGLVGFVMFYGWLIHFLLISFNKNSGYSLALKGLVLSMLVTLFFGEHLYIYRPLFAILGLFLIVTTALISFLHKNEFNQQQ